VLGLVLSESLLVTVLGGVLGLAAAWWLGVQFEPVFRQYLPGFKLPRQAIVTGGACMLALGLAAGAVPAAQAMRLRIVEALRRD
jgi:putative ABC transport system permease protein